MLSFASITFVACIFALVALSCEGFRPQRVLAARTSTSIQAFNFAGLLKPKTKIPKKSLDELKGELRSLTKGTDNGLKASDELRESIQSVCTQIEKFNKVKDLASSPVINGKWDLWYTTNGGGSSGKLGPFVGSVEQDMFMDKKEYINYVRLPAIEGALTAEWEVINKGLIKVIFKDIAFKLFGIQLVKKPFNNVEGKWRLTYADDSLRILYAIGRNNTEESLFVLAK